MSEVVLAPNHRFAVVGKTGSGKTTFSVVLACLLVPVHDPDWEIWWLDSKRDPRDKAMLKRWGFTDYEQKRNRTSRRIIEINHERGAVWAQANWWAQQAIERKNVLVVYDEYKHCCRSSTHAGNGIEDNHLRGRGLNVGMLGQTQEPVYVPRQLLSQATHLFLFDLSYPNDLKYVRGGLFKGYERPPDRKGFYHAFIDGDAEWHYYPHVRAWHDLINSAQQTGS